MITRERLEKLIHAIECESYDEEEIQAWVSSDEILDMARIVLASLDAEPDIEMLSSALRNAPLAPSDSQGRPIAPDEILPVKTGRGLKTASRIMSVIEHFEGLNGTDASNNLVLLAGVLAQYMLDNDVTDFDVLTGDVKISVDISFKD